MGEIVEFMEKVGGKILVTADHGNAEYMLDIETGEAVTAHTNNKVPLILVGEKNINLREGKLSDLAPTILDLMGLKKPDEMTGRSLIERYY